MDLSFLEKDQVDPIFLNQGFTLPEWAVQMNSSCSQGVALHVIKEGEVIETLDLDDERMFTLLGRCPVFPIGRLGTCVKLSHASISRTHAAIVRSSNEKVYLLDLMSAQGTTVNGIKVDPLIPFLLVNRNCIRFGQSSRIYMVRTYPKTIDQIQSEEPCNTFLNMQLPFMKPMSLPQNAHHHHHSSPSAHHFKPMNVSPPQAKHRKVFLLDEKDEENNVII